jgi:hypothetical protein
MSAPVVASGRATDSIRWAGALIVSALLGVDVCASGDGAGGGALFVSSHAS